MTMTMTTRRQGHPVPRRNRWLSYYWSRRCRLIAGLFLFLLLPIEDNGNAEARLSLYPAAPNARHIIKRGAGDDCHIIIIFIAVRWLQQQRVGKVICFILVAALLWWQHSFFNFICIAIGLLHQRQLGVGDFFFVPCLFIFVLLPNDDEEQARLSPQHFQWQCAFFIFYCYPTRTTRRRRRACSRTPPPPTRIVLSAAASLSLYLWPLVASKHLTIGFIIFSAFQISYCLLLSNPEA